MKFKITADCLDLNRTLFCGQCFRFERIGENEFEGIAGDKYIKLRQDNDGEITAFSDERDFWENYFDVSLCYSEILDELSEDRTLRAACENKGIRVLRQEPFETLISFIISQNNNIKRISLIIKRLCESFGERIDGGYSFPSAEKLASLSLEALAPIMAGFRDRYILDAARKVYSGEINFAQIETLSDDDARAKLKTILGVGDKVADCALLFGMHRLSVVPKDVWIKRVLAYYYPSGLPECALKYAGIAQQYLFDYARNDAKKILAR